jgi:glycosyltransferase involved in cell wall biosynthesis
MKILHIAFIKNNPYTGVCVVVPQHINHQSGFADVALLNINTCKIDGVEHQFIYHGKDWRDDVSDDFYSPDIVIFHEVYHIEFPGIAKDLQRDGIPYVIVPHGCLAINAQKQKRWKKLIANMFVFNRFIKHSSALQCLSHNEKENTHFKVFKFIGTNGINIPNTMKRDFGKQVLKICYIGRLNPHHKGLDLLIEATSRIQLFLRNKSVRIDIYGPDNIVEWYDGLKNEINTRNLGDIVSLYHAVSGLQKENVLLNSDIFIQTSRHEGMPMGILEALSYGVPCIITEGTSLGGIVRKYDAGWVAETSTDSIAITMERAICEANLLIKKSVNAKRLVTENFAWDIISNETVEQYKSICHK